MRIFARRCVQGWCPFSCSVLAALFAGKPAWGISPRCLLRMSSVKPRQSWPSTGSLPSSQASWLWACLVFNFQSKATAGSRGDKIYTGFTLSQQSSSGEATRLFSHMKGVG